MKKKAEGTGTDLVINVTLTDDSTIKKLNKKHLNRDCVTDVLSFKYGDEVDIYGEIIVNRDQATRQAEQYGNDVEHEISDLVAHGMLHLLDVHHDDDDEETVHGVKVGDKS